MPESRLENLAYHILETPNRGAQTSLSCVQTGRPNGPRTTNHERQSRRTLYDKSNARSPRFSHQAERA